MRDKAELLKRIQIQQAHLDGKDIESRVRRIDNKLCWNDCINPTFDFCSFEYRVKPVVQTLQCYLLRNIQSRVIILSTKSGSDLKSEWEKLDEHIFTYEK